MPTKIRLQRHGKKRYAYFHVVIADSRAPRDGKFIEKLGTYNPNTNPATIDIDFDSALSWVKKGAQPTDTVKALLSYKGVMHKNHLDKGVLKGAMTQEQADAKFEAWLAEKEGKINAKIEGLSAAQQAEAKKRFAAEQEANKKKADAIAAKAAELAGEAADTVEETAETVAEGASEAVEAAAEVVEETTEAVAGKAEEVVEKAAEAVEEATEEVKDAVKNAVSDDAAEEKKEEEKKAE